MYFRDYTILLSFFKWVLAEAQNNPSNTEQD